MTRSMLRGSTLKAPYPPYHRKNAVGFTVAVIKWEDEPLASRTSAGTSSTGVARLGWLVAPKTRTVYIYRPGQDVEMLNDPATVSGDPELSGGVLDMNRVFPRRLQQS